jgi:transcriptional regulator with XRE-family HTH domain
LNRHSSDRQPIHLNGVEGFRMPPGLVKGSRMAAALTNRDITTLFRLLQRYGIPQRRIAAATGQAQSEISEILNGRQVTSYPVLERICLGLGIPRGLMGLAYQLPAARRTAAGADTMDSWEAARTLADTVDQLHEAMTTLTELFGDLELSALVWHLFNHAPSAAGRSPELTDDTASTAGPGTAPT